MRRRAYLGAFAVGLAGCVGGRGENRQSATETVQANGWELRIRHWQAKKEIRYFDDSSESIQRLESENGWWYDITMQVTNLSGSEKDEMPIDRFHLVADNKKFEPLRTLPGINWSQVRSEEGYAWGLSNLTIKSDGKCPPGGDFIRTLIFDGAADRSPRVAWVANNGKKYLLKPREK
jgi:hypothetical protein